MWSRSNEGREAHGGIGVMPIDAPRMSTVPGLVKMKGCLVEVYVLPARILDVLE